MAALEHIIQAARILKAQAGSPKQTLLAACLEFWKSLFDTDEWPVSLLERAERLADRLLADGSIATTIERMNAITVDEVAEEILDLAASTFHSDASCFLTTQENDNEVLDRFSRGPFDHSLGNQ